MNKRKRLIDIFLIFIITFISLPLSVLGLWFTNKTVTLPGDTTMVTDVIEVKGASNSAGSFSTIYVISMDHSTMLQNLIVDAIGYGEVSDMPKHYLHFSQRELNLMGKIQYNSALELSIINAYTLASKENPNISFSYRLKSLAISFYYENMPFKIGDEIIGINGIDIKDSQFIPSFNNRKPGDKLTILRDNKNIEIILTEENLNKFYFEPYYDIQYAEVYPKFQVNASKTGGPSGGFIRALALYNSLTTYDYTKGLKIAGTGTIDIKGRVGKIGGIKEKILAAFKDDVDIFLCPLDNYEEALSQYNRIRGKERMQLYPVATLEEALEVLKNA